MVAMPNCGSPRCVAVFASVAVVCLVSMCFGIVEKVRFTPFYQEMKCETPPVAIRFSGMSAPSPLAEALGIAPGSPPFGLYIDMTTKSTCKNPNQADVTMKAAGSKFELFQPNMTDLALGGPGLPYMPLSEGHLARDAHFASGGGEGEIVQVSAVAIPLTDVLAISAVASVAGYAPQYIRSSVAIETRSTLFGIQFVTETVSEQWCGYYGGNCMAESLDGNGSPVTPQQLEPALCPLTKAVCSTSEADMKASLDFVAMGGEVVASIPCPPATGLPNTTTCNVVAAPGVDSATLMPLQLDPAQELTAKAQSEFDEKIEEGESAVHGMLAATIGLNAALFVLSGGMAVFCFHRLRRARALGQKSAAESPGQAASAPRILDGAPNTEGEKVMAI